MWHGFPSLIPNPQAAGKEARERWESGEASTSSSPGVWELGAVDDSDFASWISARRHTQHAEAEAEAAAAAASEAELKRAAEDAMGWMFPGHANSELLSKMNNLFGASYVSALKHQRSVQKASGSASSRASKRLQEPPEDKDKDTAAASPSSSRSLVSPQKAPPRVTTLPPTPPSLGTLFSPRSLALEAEARRMALEWRLRRAWHAWRVRVAHRSMRRRAAAAAAEAAAAWCAAAAFGLTAHHPKLARVFTAWRQQARRPPTPFHPPHDCPHKMQEYADTDKRSVVRRLSGRR